MADPPALPVRGDTRSRILEAALELFTEKGFAATTTRELSERLGFTKAALYYHFRTKDDLLDALVTPAFDRLRELIDGLDLPLSEAQRRFLLAGYVDLTMSSAELVQAFAMDPSMGDRPVIGDRWTLYQRLARLLGGVENPDLATRVRVRAALGSVHAALRRVGADDDLDVVRAAALDAACGALGIGARAGSSRRRTTAGAAVTSLSSGRR